MTDSLTDIIGETRVRMLRTLRTAPRTISELAEALAISENAVRAHVAAAERDGLVRQAERRRSTGGKPARVYELSLDAEELFPKAYALVLTEIVRGLREDEGEAAMIGRLRKVGQRLGQAVAAPTADAEERVSAAVALLESIGGSIEVQAVAEGWVLESAGCPLSAVVAQDPGVCALAEAMVTGATGLEVTERCRRLPRPRCAFRIRAAGAD